MYQRPVTILDIIVIFDDDSHMRYPGGKGKCYQQLVNLMPPHETYIESHLGGGAVLRHKRTAVRNIGIDLDPSVISRWKAEAPSLGEFIEADAVDYLENFSFKGNELVYSDPPYVPGTRKQQRIYKYEYNDTHHERLLKVIRGLPCMVMLSGYDSPLYNDMLPGWRKHSFWAKSHTTMRNEHVWMNFDPPKRLHDANFIGSNFRERQTIKRRQQRLRAKIEQMNPLERGEFLLWLAETYNIGSRLQEGF